VQQIITAKLKLVTTPEQFVALRQTQLAYRDALNAVSHYAFEQGKTSNVTRLHKGMYAQFMLVSGMRNSGMINRRKRSIYSFPSQSRWLNQRQHTSRRSSVWMWAFAI
jgi:hypothetical protein